MDLPSVYLETSVVSYYASGSSRDLIVAGHQKVTRDWVDNHLSRFDAFISQIVIDECSFGDAAASRKRIEFLDNFSSLELTPEVLVLAKMFVEARVVPERYGEDALHIAIAACHGIDYLVTWNCKHIANAQIWGRLGHVTNSIGFELPIICTPEELMGERND